MDMISILILTSTLIAAGAAVFYFQRKKIATQSKQPQQVSSKSSPRNSSENDTSSEKRSQALADQQTPPPAARTSASETQAVLRTSLPKSLDQTKKKLWGRLQDLLIQDDKQVLESIEEVLYTSDLGPKTVQTLFSKIEERLTKNEKKDAELLRQMILEEFRQILISVEGLPSGTTSKNLTAESSTNSPFQQTPLSADNAMATPQVWLVVGVNGVGKTTTIGKLAAMAAQSGKKVMVAAGDTFRAAAGNQLKAWSERAQVEIFSPEGVQDPGAVAFEALQNAKARQFDLLIVDTAGRLHTQSHLMEELKKVQRVLRKIDPTAPHEAWIVLDANSGQNALQQAKEFHQSVGLTGFIMTKMDGTAKGGVLVGVVNEVKIPVKFIGIGEKLEDLRPFDREEFLSSIL